MGCWVKIIVNLELYTQIILQERGEIKAVSDIQKLRVYEQTH